jgi:glycosyltransferase involved in cell wall biosynthesis
MRIAFLVPGFAREPVGGIRVVYALANGLSRRGHRVTVLHEALFRHPVLRRTGAPPRRQLEELVSGVRDVARGHPASVRWQDVDPAVDLRYVARATRQDFPTGDAVVATAWQTAELVAKLPAEKGRGCYLIQGLETWSGGARRVDATWRLPLRKLFIAQWLFDRGQVMQLDDSYRVPAAIDMNRFRSTVPIAARPKRVAMLYNTASGKGGADGISALGIARREIPDLEAVLFGVSGRPSGLPEWIEYVQNPTPAQLVENIYNGSALYLCPSHSEGWHLPPAEAMACGCAVVSTDISGVGEYAEHQRTAILSAVGDVEALGSSMVALLQNEPERCRIARAGTSRIGHCSWERSAAAFERAISICETSPV